MYLNFCTIFFAILQCNFSFSLFEIHIGYADKIWKQKKEKKKRENAHATSRNIKIE